MTNKLTFSPLCPELHSPKRKSFIEKMAKELKDRKVFAVATTDPVKLLTELREEHGLKDAYYDNLEIENGKMENEYVFQLP